MSEDHRRRRGRRKLLTSGEVAELFGVTRRTIDRWEEAGKLEAQRTLGGHRRFPASEVYGLLEDREVDTSPSQGVETRARTPRSTRSVEGSAGRTSLTPRGYVR